MQILFLSAIILVLVFSCNANFSWLKQECGCKSQGKRDFHKRGYEIFGENIDFELRGAVGDEKVFDGDQIFSPLDFQLFSGYRASLGSRKWPENTIPYIFTGLGGSGQTQVRNALSKLTAATDDCVKFKQSRRLKTGYVQVYSGRGCFSMIGRTGKAQDLSLGRGCLGEETIQHEFMHALGFYHEQSRPDRDEHVAVQWDNILTRTCSNFNVCRGCKITTPYDIKSIMQYQGNAFSCNRKDTMVDKNNPTNKIIRNKQLTQNDIKKIKDYYCP